MSVLYNEEEEKKYLFTKQMVCTNCEWKFEDTRVLNSKLRRKESDDDLRPRFQGIDSLKYGITACPQCGYAASAKNFEHLNKLQKKMLMDKVTTKFIGRKTVQGGQVLDYPTALEQYKLAFICAMAIELPISEQAYLCLQISWLIRGRIEELEAEGTLEAKEKQTLQEEEKRFYRQAYDGLAKAVMQEDFPICGMDQNTFYYLLAVLSFRHDDYEMAIRYCGMVVQDRSVSSKIKDKALMLKDEVVAAKKQAEEEAGGQSE